MSRMSEHYARPPLPLSPEMMQACQGYSWPGNLRELSNFIKRYLVLGRRETGHPGIAARRRRRRSAVRTGARTAQRDAVGGLKSLARSAKDEAEAEAISKALEETNWNRKQAAALLKISYKALLYKIRQYGIAQTKSHKLSAGA